MSIPATTNESWGFWGTMDGNAPSAWPLAVQAISDATRQPFEAVALFLDSAHGRHFADDVNCEIANGKNVESAVNAAVEKWMAWTIGRGTSKCYGIPRGMQYLTGFVIHCEITCAA